MIEQRFPEGPPCEVAELLSGMDRLGVGDERIRDFLTTFSRRLLDPELARAHPELGSLGFFLRPAEVGRALGSLADLRFPRGLVFHLPPANVDTVFVYALALSALAGNANVVRLSERAGPAAHAVLDALNAALGDADPAVARTQKVVSYPRDDDATAVLSQACDLRVIWGGDQAVTEIRRHPLQPWARDLTFPDRSSFAALSIPAWLAADSGTRRTAVAGLVADAYWFDQAACSAPRTIFWVGPEHGDVKTAFESLLAETVADQGWKMDAAMAVEKRVRSYGQAADGSATALRFLGGAVATLDLVGPGAMPRHWLGAGTFAHAHVPSLEALVPVIGRRDQTMSAFGFTREELTGFARQVGGRGIDRIVPFGSALTFAQVWDGYDLLAEFTRQTTITV